MTMRTSLIPAPATPPPQEAVPINACRTCNPTDSPAVKYQKFVAEKMGKLPASLGEAGKISAQTRKNLHEQLIKKTGVGLYYGDRGEWRPGKATDHPTHGSNCLDYSLEVLGDAFRAGGKSAEWDAIAAVVKKDPRGTTLARELQKRGWTTMYWAPDVENPGDGKSYVGNYNAAKAKGYYAKAGGPTKVDELLVNYAPNPDGSAIDDKELAASTKKLERLGRVPFYFGLTEGGMHTFVGGNGRVSEMHWDKPATDPGIIEVTPLGEWFDDTHTRRDEDGQLIERRIGWAEGLIMIPPGDWAAAGK